jgi:hypothetical protein
VKRHEKEEDPRICAAGVGHSGFFSNPSLPKQLQRNCMPAQVINATAIKEALLNLYLEKQPLFRSVVKSFPFDDLAGPFLMSPDPGFAAQPMPLLVVGQETSGWTSNVDDVGKQMSVYEQFQSGKTKGYSAFWDLIRKLELLFGNQQFSTAWTNLSKFDLYGIRSYGKYEKSFSTADAILADEVRIVNPGMCMFFTGPYFDNRLKAVFDGLEFVEIPGWPIKQFCALRHPLLPAMAFRSYHPRSLKLKNLEKNFLTFMSDLAAASRR